MKIVSFLLIRAKHTTKQATGCYNTYYCRLSSLFLISLLFLTDTYDMIGWTDSCRRWETDQCGIGLYASASDKDRERGVKRGREGTNEWLTALCHLPRVKQEGRTGIHTHSEHRFPEPALCCKPVLGVWDTHNPCPFPYNYVNNHSPCQFPYISTINKHHHTHTITHIRMHKQAWKHT